MLRPVPSYAPHHAWVRPIEAAWVSGDGSAGRHQLVERFIKLISTALFRLGHRYRETPGPETDILLTEAPFLRPIGWREAPLFTARRRYHLPKTPTVVAVVGADPDAWRAALRAADRLLAGRDEAESAALLAGLAPTAKEALLAQGRRGGPVLLLERALQAQAKSIRLLLLLGRTTIEAAYVFDLVGAHPRLVVDPAVPAAEGAALTVAGEPPGAPAAAGSATRETEPAIAGLPSAGAGHFREDAAALEPPPTARFPDEASLVEDVVRRLQAVVSTREITAHVTLDEPLPEDAWRRLAAPAAMRRAGLEFGRRGFFTETITIRSLVRVPAMSDAIADQYSEGCYATWEPGVGLVTTITGSARAFDKTALSDDELALIVGVRPDGAGAVVRPVAGKRNDPPSSEAVELFAMDAPLPKIRWSAPDGPRDVPVARSKLHGHRGVRAFDPRRVEYVPMGAAYFHYPVSCSTEAQALGIIEAFRRSEALTRPEDPRMIAFTIIPGHGVLIVEKWAPGKAPFQLIWEAMDDGALEITPRVPQGPFQYIPAADGRLVWPEG
ncbi:MAG: hypothetical protein IMX05_05475 [Hydrogenibacillus schlegelii]|nr:hypothetical protein [Hydrogenibacillus schlegelii]